MKNDQEKSTDFFEKNLVNNNLLKLGFGNGTPRGKRFIEQNLNYQGVELSSTHM